MQRSDTRILTTHAGSLPRPPALVDMYVRLSRREPVDATGLAAAVEESTQRIVQQQLEAGIDVGNDGEQARESFFTYVQHRMSGLGARARAPSCATSRTSRPTWRSACPISLAPR